MAYSERFFKTLGEMLAIEAAFQNGVREALPTETPAQKPPHRENLTGFFHRTFSSTVMTRQEGLGVIMLEKTMEKQLLRPRDAAAMLGLSESTLAKMRLSGAGPQFQKLGRSVRYMRAALENWVQARSRQSTSDTGRGC